MQFDTNYEVNFAERDPLTGVDPMFHRRWSPRSFQRTAIPRDVQAVLFDAARWAPSCFNEQPWMFVSSGGESDFELFLDLLVEGNQAWVKNAGVIGFVCARRHFTHNDKPNAWAAFDCGAAWMSLVLQAARLGLYAHGMAGIKKREIYEKLHIPEEKYEVISGFAIGVIDIPGKLPAATAAREKPSPRKPLEGVWTRGKLR